MEVQPCSDPVEAALLTWLHAKARSAPDLSTLCPDLLSALLDAKVPVDRLNLGVFLMHPELAGAAYQVSADDRITKVIEVSHEALRSPTYLDSPIRASVDDRQQRRFRLQHESGALPFPFLDELRSQGFTDYLLVPLIGTLGRVHVLSIATRAPEGLPDDSVTAIASFCKPFALLVDSLTTLALSEVLLRLYVGNQTGPRVLRGEVRLGAGQSIHAAILFSDMRGFARMCSTRGTVATIDVLNIYFDIVSRAVHSESGEVLKLMGDAILAVFPVQGTGEEAERAAAWACRRAATRACAEIKGAREDGRALALRAGFGLTLGEVIYGNIGAPGRLDFTIIGDAVNLAARLEKLSGALGHELLMGPRIARCADALERAIGHFDVKGFHEPVDVYTL